MNADTQQLQRNEDCRRVVLSYLAARSTVAQTPNTIAQRLRTEHDFTNAEVTSACAFLLSAELLTEHRDPLGATAYFKVTAEGILQHERSLV